VAWRRRRGRESMKRKRRCNTSRRVHRILRLKAERFRADTNGPWRFAREKNDLFSGIHKHSHRTHHRSTSFRCTKKHPAAHLKRTHIKEAEHVNADDDPVSPGSRNFHARRPGCRALGGGTRRQGRFRTCVSASTNKNTSPCAARAPSFRHGR